MDRPGLVENEEGVGVSLIENGACGYTGGTYLPFLGWERQSELDGSVDSLEWSAWINLNDLQVSALKLS